MEDNLKTKELDFFKTMTSLSKNNSSLQSQLNSHCMLRVYQESSVLQHQMLKNAFACWSSSAGLPLLFQEKITQFFLIFSVKC